MRNEGRRLFRKETFGGNGRTCETCHSRKTGTLSPEDVQERLRKDPNDPLFLHDGLDDGVSGTSRIAEHATIRIERPLPPNIRIAEDPSATSVVLLRGIPGTINTPALDPALMYDLRAPTLEDQALGAIHDHAQNTVEPTEEQLALIAEFQRTDSRFFSSEALEDFASGGPPPVLPTGNTHVGAARPSHVRRGGVHAGLHEGHLRAVPQRSDAQSDQPVQPRRRPPVRASRTSASASGTS